MAGVWVCGLITTFWAAFASLCGIFPGLFSNGLLLDDSALPEAVTRSQYTAYALGAIAVTAVVGVIFYILGTPARKNLVVDPEATPESVAVGEAV
jgi:hypothetical protein